MNKATCKICNNQYNIKTTLHIIKNLPMLLPIDYTDTCLDCIKQTLNRIKTSKNDSLKELHETLIQTHKAYTEAGTAWQAVAKEYQDLDYIENIIAHKQKPTIIPPKGEKKPRKAKKKVSKATKLAMKVLANLPKEQRDAIIANL